MIGSAFRKLARENAMEISHGVAYGSLRGYAATLFEGSGYKCIVFSTSINDPVKQNAIMEAIQTMGDKQLYKNFRVNRLVVFKSTVEVVFHDTVGTMNKIREFLDWFIPMLQQAQATGANICSECGCEITDGGSWIMIDHICHHVHAVCADKVDAAVENENEQQKEELTGSYASGALGAFLGAALGAVVWAVVLYMGFVASFVGLLIGWLTNKGYTLLKGKQGKAKVVILILAVIFGVLLGNLAADVLQLVVMINTGELYDLAYGDIPWLLMALFVEDPGFRSATFSNVGIGLLLAGLGVFTLIRRAGREVSGTKFIRLK